MKLILGINGVAGSGKDTVGDFVKADNNFTKVALADELKRAAKRFYDFTDDQLWGPSQLRNEPDKRYPREHTWGWVEQEGTEGAGYEMCHCCEVIFHEPGGGAGARRNLDAKDTHLPQCYLTPRYALQRLGTEYGRECYPNTWVDLTLRDVNALFKDHRARYSQKTGVFLEQGGERDWDEADRIEAEAVQGVAIPDVRFINEMEAIRAAGGKLIRVKRPGAGLKGKGRHKSETEMLKVPDSFFDAVIDNTKTLEDLRARVQEVLRSWAPV